MFKQETKIVLRTNPKTIYDTVNKTNRKTDKLLSTS
jgi:hypothetical protein